MWKKLTLHDVCTLRNGRAYKKPELLNDGKYRVLRVGNFFTSNNWYYSDLELDDTKYCDNGDLLYAWSASFGARIWEGEKVVYHYHIWRVDVDDSLVDKRFLFYWFEFDKELIKKASGTGTTMMHVSKSSMEQRTIYLPPLAEQQRIVAKLDAAFEEIDAAIAATFKKNKELVSFYSSAVTNMYFSDKIAPVVTVSQIAKIKGGKRLPKGNKLTSEVTPYPYIRVTDFNDDGTIDENSVQFITEEIQKNISRYTISKDDVYISIAGTIGKTGVVPDSLDNSNLTENAAKIVLNQHCLRDYFYFFTTSSSFSEQAIKQTRTAAQPKLALERLAQVVLPLHGIAEQKEIVEHVRATRQLKIELENIATKKFSQLNALKSAILAQELKSEAA